MLVNWEDASQGPSHYVPLSALKGSHCGGSAVTMLHHKKVWSGTIAFMPPKSYGLVQGKFQMVYR